MQYTIQPYYNTNIFGQRYIAGYSVVDSSGRVLKSWSAEAGQGQGVIKARRQANARKNVENYLRSLTAQEQRGVTQDPVTGNFVSELTGEAYSSEAELKAAENEFERRGRLEEDVQKFEERITESGRLREDLAERVSARREGQILTQLTNAILGSGGDLEQVQALTPQVTESTSRNLQDLITGSQAQTQRELANFIPTEISADYNQARLADAMNQFLMNEEPQRAQTQAQLDSEPEWWENILGQGASLAGRAGLAYLTGGMV